MALTAEAEPVRAARPGVPGVEPEVDFHPVPPELDDEPAAAPAEWTEAGSGGSGSRFAR